MSESFKPLHPDEGCYPGCWLELRLAICLLCTPVLHVRSWGRGREGNRNLAKYSYLSQVYEHRHVISFFFFPLFFFPPAYSPDAMQRGPGRSWRTSNSFLERSLTICATVAWQWNAWASKFSTTPTFFGCLWLSEWMNDNKFFFLWSKNISELLISCFLRSCFWWMIFLVTFFHSYIPLF